MSHKCDNIRLLTKLLLFKLLLLLLIVNDGFEIQEIFHLRLKK
jgi:hypothetical protein